MKFQKSGRYTQADALEQRRQRIACWLNDQRYGQSEARTIAEFVVAGMPTDYDWLREQVKRLSLPGDRAIARNMLARWEADEVAEASYLAEIKESRRLKDERLRAWLSSLPTGAQYTSARRGGYVAVLDGKLIARLTGEKSEGEGHDWFGCPYIESPARPLKSVAEHLASAK
jgi:hypothetical protein